METEQATQVAALNDAFRKRGFGVTVTPGIQALADLQGLLEKVRWYDDFSEDNDPYGEHDFGCIMWLGEKVFFKIDYYNQPMNGWCDPESPDCRRILTVMLAEEY